MQTMTDKHARLCGVLSTWFQAYPGDFTGSSTFYILQSFLDGLLPRGATWVAHYAIELIPLLNSVSKMEDPETSWALPDESLTEPLPEPVYIARRPSLAPSYESTHSTAPSTNQVFNTMNFIPSFSDSISISSEAKGSSDASTIATVESFGWTNSLGSGMEQRRDGKVGTQMGNLLEFSNALLELPEEVIAVQITRIAWDAFSEITVSYLIFLVPRFF